MKKTLIALAVLGTAAGVAQAQSNVTIYGNLDVGVFKKSNTTTSIGRGDNNRLGFMGSEDLGGGNAALFKIEQRFEPDTGTVEVNARPQWQGETTVGLKSATLGTVRLGRALTPLQLDDVTFDPFLTRTVGAFSPFFVGTPGVALPAGTKIYNSDSLGLATNARNRFSNGLFYNSPNMQGFGFNAAVATKEGQATDPTLSKAAYSLDGMYKNGPLALMLAYERNPLSDKVTQAGASYKVGAANLMGTFTEIKFDSLAGAPKTRIFTLGADIDAGPGKVKAGYGKLNPDGSNNSIRKFSAGYWYNLSKRTYLYVDAANERLDNTSSIRSYDFGVRHAF